MLSGVLLPVLVPVMLTAVALVVVIVPEVEVIAPVFCVALRPAWPESGVTESEPKGIAPELPVPAPPRLMPVEPEPLTVVEPKLKVALELATTMPMPVGFCMFVVPKVSEPVTVLKNEHDAAMLV